MGALCGLVAWALVGLAGATGAQAAISSTPDDTYVTNGFVYAVARTASTIYLGGLFTQVGPRTGPLVSLSATSGQIGRPLPQVSGGSSTTPYSAGVYAIVADGSGGFYIGGNFTHVGGAARENLAHILANGSVDPSWAPSARDVVRALALSGSTVYVGGNFHGAGSINGTVERNYAAALNATTSAATEWNPDANGDVDALAISPDGSTVYLGGAFNGADSINGSTTRNYAAAVNATSGAATGWNPDANGGVSALALSPDGETIYLGGAFHGADSINAVDERNYAAAVSSMTGTAETLWNPDANGIVSALALSPDGETVYLGGAFHGADSINAVDERNYAAAVNATSGTATEWNPDANGDVGALAVSPGGSTVYLGGGFSGADSMNGSTTRNHAAAVNATSGTATGWNPDANQFVSALAPSGTMVLAGGTFSSVGGQTRNNAAALSTADGTLTSWNPDANGGVEALAISRDGSTVYLGGEFNGADSINGSTTRNFAAAVNATSGAATEWNPDANGGVEALAISPDGSTVYLGGKFSGADSINASTTRNYVAAVDATSGTANGWNPDANGGVNALAISPHGSTVYLGGEFNGPDSINGTVERNYAAAVDATSGAETEWNPDANGDVDALAISPDGSTVYLGGAFHGADSINSSTTPVTRNYAAAVNATSGTATGWNPDANGGVNTLAVSPDGSTVYLGGVFSGEDAIGSSTRNYVAAVDATSGTATNWNPNATAYRVTGHGVVSALAVDGGGGVLAGGSFSSFELAPQQGIASFSAPPASTSAPTISGMPAVGQALLCSSGTFAGSVPLSFAYQWLSGGAPIAGATGSAYTVASSDAGHQLSCQVTASNLGGSAIATSAPVSVPAMLTSVPAMPTATLTSVVPTITAAHESASVWREGSKLAQISKSKKKPPVGTTFSFVLNEQATVRFSFTQRSSGRNIGHKCVAKTPKNTKRKACTRTVMVGTLPFTGHTGTNKVVFQGHISRSKALNLGAYAVTITATDSAGARSAPKSLSFTIVK